jgi:predicted heme/steroid binding protein
MSCTGGLDVASGTKWTLKADRIVVWVLLVGFVSFMVSGYALTQGWLNTAVVRFIHVRLLPIPIGLVFAYHSGYAIHTLLKRRRWWTVAGKVALGSYAVIVSLGLLSLDWAAKAATASTQRTSGGTTSAKQQADQSVKRYSAQDLAQYDGQNGRPAYVAIHGVVYDVSTLYRGGNHFGCWAGKDVSQGFSRKHPMSLVRLYPKVGVLT